MFYTAVAYFLDLQFEGKHNFFNAFPNASANLCALTSRRKQYNIGSRYLGTYMQLQQSLKRSTESAQKLMGLQLIPIYKLTLYHQQYQCPHFPHYEEDICSLSKRDQYHFLYKKELQTNQDNPSSSPSMESTNYDTYTYT